MAIATQSEMTGIERVKSNNRLNIARIKKFILFSMLIFLQLAHQKPHTYCPDFLIFIRDGFLHQVSMMLIAIKEDVQHNGAKGCEHNAAM